MALIHNQLISTCMHSGELKTYAFNARRRLALNSFLDACSKQSWHDRDRCPFSLSGNCTFLEEQAEAHETTNRIDYPVHESNAAHTYAHT